MIACGLGEELGEWGRKKPQTFLNDVLILTLEECFMQSKKQNINYENNRAKGILKTFKN